MEEKLRKWKKKKWVIVIPLLIAATAVYTLCFASDDNAVVVSDGGAAGTLGDGEGAGGAGAAGDDGRAGGADEGEDSAAGGADAVIYVDVGGAVVDPHVVMLSEGARIYEAVDAAGGLMSDAEIKYMNMAALCEDGAKIYVPTKQEIEEADASGGGAPGAQLFASGGSGDASSGSSAVQANNGNSGKVNINTADSAALQTLTGIGPSMAQRIIDYRDANGKFSSPDELQNVSGIGEKTLSKIIGSICV